MSVEVYISDYPRRLKSKKKRIKNKWHKKYRKHVGTHEGMQTARFSPDDGIRFPDTPMMNKDESNGQE